MILPVLLTTYYPSRLPRAESYAALSFFFRIRRAAIRHKNGLAAREYLRRLGHSVGTMGCSVLPFHLRSLRSNAFQDGEECRFQKKVVSRAACRRLANPIPNRLSSCRYDGTGNGDSRATRGVGTAPRIASARSPRSTPMSSDQSSSLTCPSAHSSIRRFVDSVGTVPVGSSHLSSCCSIVAFGSSASPARSAF